MNRYIHKYMYIYVYIYIYIYTYVCVCMNIRVAEFLGSKEVNLQLWQTCIYIYMYICMYILHKFPKFSNSAAKILDTSVQESLLYTPIFRTA